MILETICVGTMQVNCYVLACGKGDKAIIIDPGDEENKIRRVLDKYNLKAAFIINTHGHIDHIGCDDKFAVPVYIHSDDAALLSDPQLNLSSFLTRAFSIKTKVVKLEDGQSIELEKIKMEVMHLPGHTPGGIALLLKAPEGNALFSGDSLFYHSVGRTDFPGSDGKLLADSIKKKIFKLSDDTVVYPGHGPSTTVGEEKRNNPFLN